MFSCQLYNEETNKSALTRHVEKQVSPANFIPKPSACTIDAMAFLHKMNVEKKPFVYLTEIIFTSALKDGTSSDRIDLIFDVYKDNR